MPQKVEDRRARRLERFDLFEFEFLTPGDERPPDHLIDQYDYGDHGEHSPDDRAGIAGVSRRLQVRAKPRQAEVAISQYEHLARHQEEPAARNGHHGIPYQTDRRIRQFDLHELL